MKVLVTGASGFVGSEIIRQLKAEGHDIRVLERDPTKVEALGHRLNVEVRHGNVIHAPSLAGCADGVDAIIHIVGIIYEKLENTFDRVHRAGTVNMLAEAKKSKVKRFIHMSALGTREGAQSGYHKTKWAAEEAVRASGLDWTIFRPSIIYGPGDGFVSQFAGMMRFPKNLLQFFCIPLPNEGESQLQPIPVGDVARCFVGALSKPESVGKVFDLCGPRPLPLKEVLSEIAHAIGKDAVVAEPPFKDQLGACANWFFPITFLKAVFIQPKVVLVPFPRMLVSTAATLMEGLLPNPPLTKDQVLMLGEPNIGDPKPAMETFGIQPPDFHTGLGAYLHP
jgi:uncharacterized protein YbjT (DUF2867 family)